MKRLLFRKSQRLVSNEQFVHVLSCKLWAQNKLARLYVSSNDVGYPRLGLSVSKKCGNAVTRNRIKRLARQAFRLNQHDIPRDYDYLLIFSNKLSKKSKDEYSKTVRGWTQQTISSAFLNLVEKAVKKA